MKTLKKIGQKFLDIFGFRKNSKYVGNYLDSANMRSALYMSAIIVILEVWLLIRQTNKYIAPALREGKPFFQTVFTNTSNFWLLLSLGLVMFVYTLFYIGQKRKIRHIREAAIKSAPIHFFANSRCIATSVLRNTPRISVILMRITL